MKSSPLQIAKKNDKEFKLSLCTRRRKKKFKKEARNGWRAIKMRVKQIQL